MKNLTVSRVEYWKGCYMMWLVLCHKKLNSFLCWILEELLCDVLIDIPWKTEQSMLCFHLARLLVTIALSHNKPALERKSTWSFKKKVLCYSQRIGLLCTPSCQLQASACACVRLRVRACACVCLRALVRGNLRKCLLIYVLLYMYRLCCCECPPQVTRCRQMWVNHN